MSTSPKIKKRPTWIPVVAAVISKKGKVLLGERPEGSSLAGVWEFPGGKIEASETPEQALKRELKEELGIEAEVSQLLLSTTHQYGDVGILILFYKVDYWKGEPRTHHHNGLKWVSKAEFAELELPEANRKVLPRLLKTF
ncbi:MAG: 8-oxo-dGTP diphosphatase MutT [Bdellovibrionales bacterium]